MRQEMDVGTAIAEKLQMLVDAVEAEKELEIDGVTIDEGVEGLKILHMQRKEAYFVPLDLAITTPARDLVRALTTGENEILRGYTRIVGYYSRVGNWNKSKLAELKDRSKGNYFEGGRKDGDAIGKYANSKY